MNTCPHCATDLRGEAIPQESIDKGYYGDSTHFRREIGYSQHDYIQFWICPDCRGTWNRWADDSPYFLLAEQLRRTFNTADGVADEHVAV